MKILKKSSYLFGLLLLAAFFLLNACRKDDVRPQKNKLTQTDVDSLKFYTWWINESDSENIPLYLWYDQVPDDFPWWSDQYATGDDMLSAMRSYAKEDGKKVDRYSFLDLTGIVSDELQGGTQGDFGFMVAAAQDPSGNIYLFVEYVYKNSPAAIAGLSRGDLITKINGNSDMNIDNKPTARRIDSALFGSKSISLTLQKQGDHKTFTVNLDAAQYHLNPVLFDSVYTVGGEKVGYFVYNSFVNVASVQNGYQAKKEIDTVFSKFKQEGIQDLIVDLRYNGGGSVASSEYLDNLIAPTSAVGKEMYRTLYNDQLTAYYNYYKDKDEDAKEAIEPVNFSAENNNLNLNRVFFIVSRGTASASELTINNLRPYMDVKLVGDTTYGKPVGFFGIPISFVTENNGYQHVADMYAINFKSINSAGEGDYYSGMLPDVLLYDYVDLSWGDTQDPRLESIFNYIKGNGFLHQDYFDSKRNSAQSRLANRPVMLRKSSSVRIENPHQFKGMVDYRKHNRMDF